MKVLVKFNKNISTPKQVKTFKVFNLGEVVTTVNDLLDNSIIEIDDQTLPVLKITESGNDKFYLVNDLGATPGLTYPYYTDDFTKEITIDDLIIINIGNGIINHSELILDDGTNPHGTTKSDVGLGNVDDTSDIDKPISTATQNALNLKENLSNKATNLISPDNTKYPTTLAVSTALDGKQNVLTNPITGTGTTNYLSKFTGSGSVGNSQIFDNGTNVGIGTTSPNARLEVNGNMIVGAGNKSIGGWPFYISDPSNLGWKVSDSSGTAKFELYVGNVGINQMRLLGGVSIVGFNQNLSLGTSAYLNILNISNTNGNVGIGTTSPGARLDVRAQGALSTDIAFRVRNSTDTQNFLVVNGAGDVSNSGAGGGETNTQFGINVGRNRTGNYNSLFGHQAGRDLTTGINNVLFGYNAGRSITTQSGNTLIGSMAGESTIVNYTVAVGTNALVLNQTGVGNVAVGTEALYATTASVNTALGHEAGNSNTTGQRNIFLGYASGRGNTTGNFNAFIGVSSAFYSNGSNNVFLGDNSGMYQSDGITNMTSADNSVFIGKDVKANSSGQTNQIVIGHNAIGDGSNSVVLGNSSITRTRLQGQVIIGTFATAPTGIEGAIYYNSTDKKHYGFNGTTWNALY